MGSNPIARSSTKKRLADMVPDEPLNASQNVIYGDVAKWQGKGLQNPHHGFKSHRRLKKKTGSNLSFLFLNLA